MTQQQMFPPAIPFSVSVKTLNLQLGQVVSIDSLDGISGISKQASTGLAQHSNESNTVSVADVKISSVITERL